MARRGLTLNQLAKRSEVSPSTLRNTKRRGGELKAETIERICAALGISLSEFFAEPDGGKSGGEPVQTSSPFRSKKDATFP